MYGVLRYLVFWCNCRGYNNDSITHNDAGAVIVDLGIQAYALNVAEVKFNRGRHCVVFHCLQWKYSCIAKIINIAFNNCCFIDYYHFR